ncbi:MAG: hypothetical protein ACRDJB_10175 [Actinomycetota bacterium]
MNDIQVPDLDVVPIIEALNRHRVRYVVIGGIASLVHRADVPRTLDVDVTPSRDEGNLKQLAAALKELGAQLRAPGLDTGFPIPLDERMLTRMTTLTLVTPYGPLDLSFVPDGTTGYEDLAQGATMVSALGVQFPVAALADVIRSKEAAGRAKDLEHLPALRRRLKELQTGVE